MARTAQSQHENGMPQIPPYPKSAAERDFSVGMRLSVALHVALSAVILFKTLIFPEETKPYIPTLRVDLVGLPDHLKKDASTLNKAPLPSKEVAEALKRADEQLKEVKAQPKVKPEPKVERAQKDEMVVKPKNAPREEKQEKTKTKDIKSALARIKALERIKNETTDSPVPRAENGTLIKGNQISRGTSLDADAREAAEASYHDLLRDRIRDNWELPVWIARQNYSAQVQVFIDGYGRIRAFRFMKPSGNAQFDEAVKKALNASQPFPRPPTEVVNGLQSNGVLIGFPL